MNMPIQKEILTFLKKAILQYLLKILLIGRVLEKTITTSVLKLILDENKSKVLKKVSKIEKKYLYLQTQVLKNRAISVIDVDEDVNEKNVNKIFLDLVRNDSFGIAQKKCIDDEEAEDQQENISDELYETFSKEGYREAIQTFETFKAKNSDKLNEIIVQQRKVGKFV